jgi:hypothetical protein
VTAFREPLPQPILDRLHQPETLVGQRGVELNEGGPRADFSPRRIGGVDAADADQRKRTFDALEGLAQHPG